MRMSGARMTVEALAAEGVSHVFGIPGGSVIPLYDALYDAPFEHILMRHEQAAAHAADGYARITGKPGVCLCTSGPGFTNIITGLATASADSVPMVAITGQVATHLIGTDAFQESDAIGSSLPMVRHSYRVERPEDLPSIVKSAFELAVSGRPGPVLIELPVDVQRATAEFRYPEESPLPECRRGFEEDLSSADEAAALLRGAQRPVVLAGGGIVSGGASRALLRFAEKLRIPVAVSLMGKGGFPENHPLFLGMAGMHGSMRANKALTQADLVLAIGTRFSDRTTGRLDGFAREAAIIHVDTDASEIGKIVAGCVPLVADAAGALDALAERLPDVGRVAREEWMRRIGAPTAGEANGDFSPASILERIQRDLPPETPVVTDVGQNQMWVAQHWRTSLPRTFLSSGGLGTMGYALPAAMGAALAGGGQVLCFAGDGGFLMNSQELDTCARYRLPVKIFILNNGCLGMVRQWQELFWEKRYAHTVHEPSCRFEALAEAYGVDGYTCSSLPELGGVLERALSKPGPALVDCRIGRGENVFPMVPAGASLADCRPGPAVQ